MPNINTDHIFNHPDIKQIEEAAWALRRVRASVAELCRELADKMS